MKLTCLSQGSIGNCWLLETETETLILDAGVSDKVIEKALGFNWLKVSGVVITHCHSDHSLSAKKLEDKGLKVFKPYECEGKLERQFKGFNIKAFSVPHAETPCYGFLIAVEGQKILYATDFEYIKYSFKKVKLNHILIECNWQEKFLNKDAENIRHKVLGHCSLETCKGFLEANETEELETVILTHLGVETCDGEEIVEEIRKTLKWGKKIAYARAMETYLLGEKPKCPF